ncbi:hypothetical protein HK100_007344, partial [Physocladia obscura]
MSISFQSGNNGAVEWASNCDWTGGDISNTPATGANCGITCLTTTGCARFTWTDYGGGTCWLKSSAASATPVAAAGTVCGYTTPTLGGYTFAAGNGGAVMWASDCDWTGGDVTSAAGAGASCGAACLATTGCARFTWTDYGGGTCWLKSSAASATPVAGSGICGYTTGATSASARQLVDAYDASNIFQMVDFFDGADPTHGDVVFLSGAGAQSAGLAYVQNNIVYFAADSTNVYASSGRPSIRWSSINTYSSGLFVFDVVHMPAGCATWPALWLLGTGQTWPYAGEIDIIEGVNQATTNQQTLHTSEDCSFTASQMAQTATLDFGDCNSANGANGNEGCGTTNYQANAYGAPFNANGGGVYATEWSSTGISIWFFPRNAIPSDITAGAPNPAGWGTPSSNWPFGSWCTANHFQDMTIVLDTTFCGDWAGNAYGSPCLGGSGIPACNWFVQHSPSAFTEAYWAINSLK